MKKIFLTLLFIYSTVSAADTHFTCNAKSFNTTNGMDKYEEKGKLEINIQGNLIKITGFIIQPITVYLKPTTDEWGLEHKMSYNYSMPFDSYDGLWDVGNTMQDHRDKDYRKWWESATSFSLDKRYDQLRYRQHQFIGGGHFIQNLDGICKEVI